jgi:ribonuclease HII
MLKTRLNEHLIEVGCDEAGRGCLAGPVFAAAVIIPEGVKLDLINDSKQLSEKKRIELRQQIETECIWAVAAVYQKEIDSINILNASIKAMMLAIDQIKSPFEHIVIDGNRFKPYKDIPYTTVVKGDSKIKSIAAASVLAKTHRDDYMSLISKEFPEYQWTKNKGYPTMEHRDAIRKIGPCIHHRMSFTLLPQQLSLGL